MYTSTTSHTEELDRVEATLRRARRERRKGRHRKSMLLLRGAAFEARERPGVWTRYALSCMKSGKTEEGRKAFAQAAWLHERQGNGKAAEITRSLAAEAEAGRLPVQYSH